MGPAPESESKRRKAAAAVMLAGGAEKIASATRGRTGSGDPIHPAAVRARPHTTGTENSGLTGESFGGIVTRTEGTTMVTVKDLEAFGDGWNRHDVDYLMTFMTDDCVFELSAGPDPWGKRFVGKDAVREGFAGVFKRFPDVHFGNTRHFVSGDRGLSEWLFTGTTADGKKVEVTGCDVFTFRGDKIAVKNSYLKSRTG